MAYSKMAESDLKQGMNACMEAIEHCHRILDVAANNPEIKVFKKVTKSMTKEAQRLENEFSKLEKALSKSKAALKRD